MTPRELELIFRHQLTETEEYTPPDELDYWLFNGFEKVQGTVARDNIASLVPLLEGYVLEGYRDKTPLFIKPEEGL